MVETPIRKMQARVDDALWADVQAKLARRRETLSDVIRRALLAYVEDGPTSPGDPL